MLNSGMKTITMVDLRTDSERIVKDLHRGVRMTLSYRGKPLAELVPLSGEAAPGPLEALDLAQQAAGQALGLSKSAAADYLSKLRREQRAWSERS